MAIKATLPGRLKVVFRLTHGGRTDLPDTADDQVRAIVADELEKIVQGNNDVGGNLEFKGGKLSFRLGWPPNGADPTRALIGLTQNEAIVAADLAHGNNFDESLSAPYPQTPGERAGGEPDASAYIWLAFPDDLPPITGFKYSANSLASLTSLTAIPEKLAYNGIDYNMMRSQRKIASRVFSGDGRASLVF